MKYTNFDRHKWLEEGVSNLEKKLNLKGFDVEIFTKPSNGGLELYHKDKLNDKIEYRVYSSEEDGLMLHYETIDIFIF